MGQRGWVRWIIVIALAASAFAVATFSAADDCDETRATVSGEWGRAHFTVVLADDPTERARGLMFVESLPMLEGMLFVYPSPTAGGHWMKDTLVPLDIAYADAAGNVFQVVEGKPLDTTVLVAAARFQYVLEVPVGWFARNGLGPGAQLLLPGDLPAGQ